MTYLKFSLVCFLHNLDMISDILYICTVPAYNVTIQILIVVFIIPPIVISIMLWFFGPGTGDFSAKSYLLRFFGVFPIYKLYQGEDDTKKLSEGVVTQGILFILEDGP